MLRRIPTVLLLTTGLIATGAHLQPRTAAAQVNPVMQPGETPVFHITVVGRTMPAINYRPRRGDTKIDFAGTALLPRAKGEAKVSGAKGYMRIDARFDELEPPARFGREYLTYVLWAITPEGRATNLGEVQYDDDEARVKVTTELQAFGLMVTAEPYFAVTQPSDVVVMENVVRDGTKGKVETVQARVDLLQRGTYLMSRDPAQLKVKALEPGAPLDLAQARNAVELARLAGADQYASETFERATQLLGEAEQARERRRGGNAVMMPARQAAQTAEDARLVSLKRQAEADAAAQRAAAAQRERDAVERAKAEETKRQQAEQQARVEQERRQQAEVDARVAAATTAAAERERTAAQAGREAAEQERRAAEAARHSAEAQAQQAHAAIALAEREKQLLRARVQEQLNVILETRETARGLIVNLSDVLFDTGSATLKSGAREKLARVAGVLASHPGLRMSVEGHTDSVGAANYNQQLSEARAHTVRDYLVRQGLAPGAVGTTGFGEEQPVASNDSSAGRQQNRRVELVVTGEAIGR